MFDKIKATLKNSEFQRNAAQLAGSAVSFVATIVISNLVHTAVSSGIDMLMDKIQNTETPAE